MAAKPTQRGWLDAFFDRLVGWRSGLPWEQTSYTKLPVTIPLEGDDGVELAADLYQPKANTGKKPSGGGDAHAHAHAPAAAAAAGTILVQSPYGRRAPMSILLARTWAARGYNVLLVSTRGTFGSGGQDRFDPGRRDQEDAIRVVRWMRAQPWYTGSFATFGLSYLGYTQYALMDADDPLDDYAAAVIHVAPHDFSELLWGTGALWLPCIDWAEISSTQESLGGLRMLYKLATISPDGYVPAKKAVPLVDGARAYLGAESPSYRWLGRWLTSSREDQQADPLGYWRPMKHGGALDRTKVPILLVGGWQDIFVRSTLEQYARLRAQGCTVGLTMGPWHHGEAAGAPGVMRESWDWMEKHLSRRAAGEVRRAPVRVDFSGREGGGEKTRWLPSWPPATAPMELHLEAPGRLAAGDRGGEPGEARFTFDPHDPTPTLGGPLLFNGGYVDDAALARRADVLSFTTGPLDRDVAVAGAPRVELLHGSDNPHADLFVRLCDVGKGSSSSRNVCEAYRRLDPGRAPPGRPVRIELDVAPCAHVFKKGNAIRLVVAGGNFPHYSYNLGSGENQGTGTTLRPATHTVHTGGSSGSKLVLPVS